RTALIAFGRDADPFSVALRAKRHAADVGGTKRRELRARVARLGRRQRNIVDLPIRLRRLTAATETLPSVVEVVGPIFDLPDGRRPDDLAQTVRERGAEPREVMDAPKQQKNDHDRR